MADDPFATAASSVCVGTHPDQPTHTDIGQLCYDCWTRLRSQLCALPAVAGWLHVFLAAGGAAGERVSGSREDPIPLRVDILDLIGPDSRSWVKGATLPQFLLWDGAQPVGVFDSWRAATTACRDAMLAAGIPDRIIGMLRQPFTHDEWKALSDADKAAMDTAHTRWQVRPTEVGGADQRGEDAIRNRLFYWVQRVADEAGFPWPERCDLIPPLVDWLTGHLSWIVEQPWVGELADDVHRIGTEAHRVATWNAEIRRDPHPCGTCGKHTIVIHLAEGHSRCEKKAGGCGRVIVWDHRNEHRRAG